MAPPSSDASPGAAPTVADLLAVGPDDWAALLRLVRRALHGLDDVHVTPAIARLRASPASRLAGGRLRTALAEELAAGGPVWREVHAQLAAADLPAGLVWLREGARPPDAATAPPAPPAGAADVDPGSSADLVRRLKARARTLRSERDDARRRLDGAAGRIRALEEQVGSLTAALADERERVTELEVRLSDAEADRARAVEREQRRREHRVAELEAELREVRRRDEQRREERARERRAREVAEQRAREGSAHRERRTERPRTVVAGRPTVLPPGVAPDTREEAEALLAPGRLVYLDGYNITLGHTTDLALEEQRAWLVRLAAGLVARRRVRPTVVFDGRGGGSGASPGGHARRVRVVFTPEGVTADDEIVLAVQATDEPVVVVTDDNGLRDRLRPHGVDLLRVRPFLWAAG